MSALENFSLSWDMPKSTTILRICKTSRVDALQTICIDFTNNAIKKGICSSSSSIASVVRARRYSVMLAYRDDNIFGETLFFLQLWVCWV